MQEGLKKAVGVPLKLAQTASALFTPLLELSEIGNINCKSDLQVSINLEIKKLSTYLRYSPFGFLAILAIFV